MGYAVRKRDIGQPVACTESLGPDDCYAFRNGDAGKIPVNDAAVNRVVIFFIIRYINVCGEIDLLLKI